MVFDVSYQKARWSAGKDESIPKNSTIVFQRSGL